MIIIPVIISIAAPPSIYLPMVCVKSGFKNSGFEIWSQPAIKKGKAMRI
jgi:hypothetical protein